MSGDREALVAMLVGAGVWLDRAGEVADQILESDWLRDHDREVAAKTLDTVVAHVGSGTVASRALTKWLSVTAMSLRELIR